MKIAVVGMWHLGTVTATCLSSGGHEVVGIDEDAEVIAGLRQKRLPVAEPGLQELAAQQIAENRLRFSSQFSEVAGSEIVWIAYDTPVDDQDRADTGFVISRVEALFPYLSEGSIVLISSQMPVGSTARLERKYREFGKHTTVSFAFSPENLRLGKAIEVFTRPDQVVAGVRTRSDRERIEQMLRRSSSVETWRWLSAQGAHVKAFDPAVREIPAEPGLAIELAAGAEEALKESEAVLIATE